MSINISTKIASARKTFFQDVVRGLSKRQKTLPCKYFYDERGSALFEQICETQAYYPTRTELDIMQTNIESIASHIGRSALLVEYGSGSSVKTRILLDALDTPVAYVPVDISVKHLHRTVESLSRSYPNTEILPVAADFTRRFEIPKPVQTHSHVTLYFPGSTIGNFTPIQAGKLLQNMSTMLGNSGRLLIGIDLQKDISVLEEAYNDCEGVTAEFNFNILTRINHELGGDFSLDQFEHRAVYNRIRNRIEMSIVSQCDQKVTIGNSAFAFLRGEEILTELSHKYTINEFANFASQFGFSLHQHWTDRRGYFGVLLLILE